MGAYRRKRSNSPGNMSSSAAVGMEYKSQVRANCCMTWTKRLSPLLPCAPRLNLPSAPTYRRLAASTTALQVISSWRQPISVTAGLL